MTQATRDTKVWMVGNHKGGVGKTTTTFNIGYELAKRGFKVLLIDQDGQTNCSKYAHRKDTEFYLGDALMDRKFDLRKAIYPVIIDDIEQDNFHIVPAKGSDQMAQIAMNMTGLPKREERLKMHLDIIKGEYDYVIIDTSPTSSVLALNAVIAAEKYIIATELIDDSFDGIDSLLEHICNVKFIEEDEIDFIILPTKVDGREKTMVDAGMEYLKSLWPDKIAKTIIYNRIDFKKAAQEHQPISYHNKGSVAAVYYKDFVKELLNV